MRRESLCENRDFKRLYARGRSFVTPLCVVYVMKNRLGVNRVGIKTSKKIGCAVKRNRARRLLSEGYRLIAAEHPVRAGMDIVLVARGRTPHSGLWAVKSALLKSFEAAGLIEKR